MEQEKRIFPVHATPELLSEIESLVIRGGGTAATTDDTNTYCGNANCGNCIPNCFSCPLNPVNIVTTCGIVSPNVVNICNRD